MESLEKVFSNLDLLKLIFNELNFKDQLQLAQVNGQLRCAFELLSGNVNYSSMGIILGSISNYDIYAIGRMGVIYKRIESSVLADYLEVCAPRVCDLIIGGSEMDAYETILRKLRNLRSLTTYKMSRSVFEKYCKRYSDLQELTIVGYVIDDYYSLKHLTQAIGEYMKNLLKLQITAIYTPLLLCENILQITHLSKLEFLKIEIRGLAIQLVVPLDGTINLKELQITNVTNFEGLPLHNLKVLHIRLHNEDNGKFFSIVREYCKNLEVLSLHNTKFQNLTNITLPPKLKELSMYNCDGLMHSCLKRILKEFQLSKFCSRGTRYIGEFHDFRISSNIQSLEIDFVEMTKFKLAYDNNSQLRQLKWKHLHLSSDQVSVICITTPNLQRLNMPYHILAITAISDLNSLQSLKLQHCCGFLKLSDIMHLLNHPTLKELNICTTFDTSRDSLRPSVLPEMPPTMSLHTNIIWLRISPIILKTWMTFWLKLFSTNMQMTLVCSPIPKTNGAGIACSIIYSKHFPRQLKTIQICCETLDCDKLRKSNLNALQTVWRIFFNSARQTLGQYAQPPIPSQIVLSWTSGNNL